MPVGEGDPGMGTPFLGEIKIVSFNFAPKGWALCNGQFLPINQNQALFSLFGTQYGGNGQTTFALPNLRGQCAMNQGGGFTIGQQGGTESVTVNQSQMPTHVHVVQAISDVADTIIPGGNYLAGINNGYRPASALLALVAPTVANSGGSQPHENMSPFIVMNFIVALIGVFPSQN